MVFVIFSAFLFGYLATDKRAKAFIFIVHELEIEKQRLFGSSLHSQFCKE